jgi:hypothetical protein
VVVSTCQRERAESFPITIRKSSDDGGGGKKSNEASNLPKKLIIFHCRDESLDGQLSQQQQQLSPYAHQIIHT